MKLGHLLWGLLSVALASTMASGQERNAAQPFEIISLPSEGDDAVSASLIKLRHDEYPSIELGYANIAKGTRLPAEGLVQVPGDDVGIVLDGVQTAIIVEHTLKITGRQIAHVFPNTPQAAYYDTDQKLIFIWFGKSFSDDQIKRAPIHAPSEKNLPIWRRKELNTTYALLPLFRDKSFAAANVNVVYERVPAGQMIRPANNTGQRSHDFRIILSGKAETTVGGKVALLEAGDIIHFRHSDDWNMKALEKLEVISIRYEKEEQR